MNTQAYWTLLLLACIASVNFNTKTMATERPPNVVLILVDDLGYGDLGCYGATKVQTPNIDRLAREGRRFTDAHSASAVCTPSRYGLLTGEYPVRRNIWGPAPSSSPLLIDTEKLTIADVLKNRGYNTAAVGKWHLGFGKGTNNWQEPLRPGPQDLGFDYYFGVPVVSSAPPFVFVENDRVFGGVADDPLVFLGRKNAAGKASPITPLTEEHGNRSPNAFGGATKAHKLYNDFTLGTTLVERSTKWIREQSDKPFFLYLATSNIHHPFTPAPRFQGTSQCGLYGDFIHELDWMVGEVMTTLEEKGIADNTLVIFTSDNGGMFNHSGQKAFSMGHRVNGDLLGFKFGVWEGGHRVPFIARWPGKIKPGTTSSQLISSVDMLATFAALTQQTLEKEQLADSVNVLPSLIDEPKTPVRDTLVLCPNSPAHLAIRKGKWVYIGAQGEGGFNAKPGAHAAGGPAAASFVGNVNSDIEDGKIKQDAPPSQLYDLESDLTQTKNVYRENPQVVKEMEELLNSYRPKNAKGDLPINGRRGKTRPSKQAARPVSNEGPVAPRSEAQAQSQSPVTKPNIVFIFADDWGWGDLSCHGHPWLKTPNLDRLAREGTDFQQFNVLNPVCSPSRTAVMTGHFPARYCIHQHFAAPAQNHQRGMPDWLDPQAPTLPRFLKQAGYRTAHFGKWHLTNRDTHGSPPPEAYGYDEFAVFNGGAEWPSADLHATAANAVSFIKANKDQPFFINVWLHESHTPHFPTPESMAKWKHTDERKQVYSAVITDGDNNVGSILDALKAEGLEGNTIVIFSSDNGPEWTAAKAGPQKRDQDANVTGYDTFYSIGQTGGLRGRKRSLFEGGVRVPFLVRWPGHTPAGAKNDTTAFTAVDLLPTLCAAAGVTLPADYRGDGENLLDALQGKSITRTRPIFWEWLGNKTEPDWWPRLAVRDGDWKLALTNDAKRVELHRLTDDRAESADLAKDHPEIVARLTKLALDWKATLPEKPNPDCRSKQASDKRPEPK